MLGDRIKRARKAQGFSLRDLAERIKLSHAAIKKYEDNNVTPSSDILIKLAKELHVKVEYFFRSDYFVFEEIQYRTHSDIPKQHLKAINAKVLDQIERRVELENLFPTSPVKSFKEFSTIAQVSSYEDLEDVANQIRKQWNLGLEPIPALIDIFEEQGIKVFEIENQQFPKFDGLFTLINKIPVIVIGSQWPGDRQRFTLCHELGHLVLNKFFSTPLGKRIDQEKYCNRFAGAFLLPNATLISALGKHRNQIEARELNILKEEFGISMAAILHRAEDIGIISKKLYDQLRSEFKERGWLETEPGNQYPREKAYIFEQMIFHALAEEYIGEARAAELMNISIGNLRSLRAMESHESTHY